MALFPIKTDEPQSAIFEIHKNHHKQLIMFFSVSIAVRSIPLEKIE